MLRKKLALAPFSLSGGAFGLMSCCPASREQLITAVERIGLYRKRECVRGSVRHRSQIGFQLREVETWCKAGLLRFRRQDRVGLVDALIPPRPGGLLRNN